MPNTKISALTALTGANLATDDAFAVVDTSATATKKITVAELKLGIMPAPGPIGGTTPSSIDPISEYRRIYGCLCCIHWPSSNRHPLRNYRSRSRWCNCWSWWACIPGYCGSGG